MKCPHCLEGVHESWETTANPGADADANWHIFHMKCPECMRFIFRFHKIKQPGDKLEIFLGYPQTTSRSALSPDVPSQYASDYREACLVFDDSAKASAALSRRCLQGLLREEAKVKHRNLSAEIEEVMTGLPSHLGDAVDGVRNIGNFAAHPMMSTNTGEVVDVEPGEAEWLLDTLEGLFDFYFVQPKLIARKRAELNDKLKDAGKPPMK